MNKPTPTSRRVSLACVPCRSKHLRCDATTPICARCRTEGLQCVYLKSRRGGRRPRQSQLPSLPSDTAHPVQQAPAPSLDSSILIRTSRSISDDDQSISEPSSASRSDATSDSSVRERFMAQYYSSFHAAHPCVLPHWDLKQRLASDGQALQSLVPILHYIGSVYAKSANSPSLKLQAEQAVACIGTSNPPTGFDVQAILLLSIAIYWGNEPDKALDLLDKAIALALELGMHKQEYAYANGNEDPLLEECWRRTWWQVYMTDAHIAGSTSTFPFRTSGLDISTDLPCDEADYEFGKIPRPRTLQDYDMREFLGDDERQFSSFAELVGLTRGLDIALTARNGMTIANAPWISANTDATVTAWQSLLHPSKKNLVREDGTVDELLFKANIIIQTYVVELHRQLSTLSYSPVESIAHCSPPPPPESLRGCNTPECQLHTAKVLRAIDEFDNLLTLPTKIETHTPFIICMTSNLVIAHLAACRFHYKQKDQMKLARERIRLSMGALKTLGEFWPMGQRTYKEVGIIARDILGLKDRLPTSAEETPKQTVDITDSTREVRLQGAASASETGPAAQPPTSQFEPALELDPESAPSDVAMFLDPPSLSDFQLLDTDFDFCGLFDMNFNAVPSMAVV
ncbi:putative C6 transcription factor [Aspergillus undulatus]|uniref:putative C6 transcription factor n=1 Tax=Aspergillus undulatus TaxID=1810928 RepID=UPI003CCDFBF4